MDSLVAIHPYIVVQLTMQVSPFLGSFAMVVVSD